MEEINDYVRSPVDPELLNKDLTFQVISWYGRDNENCDEEISIKKEIDTANYCNTEEDCALAGSICPFGCKIYVNNAEKDRIRELMISFEPICKYECPVCEGLECKNNKCKIQCMGFWKLWPCWVYRYTTKYDIEVDEIAQFH